MGYDMQMREREGAAGYFRLNIFGMGTARKLMEQADVITWDETPDSTDWSGLDDLEEGDDGCQEAHDKVVGVLAPSGRIPAEKFCSNDGWWVTSEECATNGPKLLAFLADKEVVDIVDRGERRTLKADDLGYYKEFAQFMVDAAECGGFEVW